MGTFAVELLVTRLLTLLVSNQVKTIENLGHSMTQLQFCGFLIVCSRDDTWNHLDISFASYRNVLLLALTGSL